MSYLFKNEPIYGNVHLKQMEISAIISIFIWMKLEGVMNIIDSVLEIMDIDKNKEISMLFKNSNYPSEYNPVEDFHKEVIEFNGFIEKLIEKQFLPRDISNFNVLEIGGGVCSKGAAFAKKCNAVVSFELEAVHCLYAKRCKEYFNISNLAVYLGSITNLMGNKHYSVKENSVDMVISYSGMFRDTILDTLDEIHKVLKPGGKFICVYPRFWTNSTGINSTDKELLNRGLLKNENWSCFETELKEKLKNLNFKVEHEGMLENHETMTIGGDVIIGSNIATTREEYVKAPIDGLVFGKTLITCNTLICEKQSLLTI